MEIKDLVNCSEPIRLTDGDLQVFATFLVRQYRPSIKSSLERVYGDRMLSEPETRAILHRSVKTLWDWANKGILVPVKVGRTNFYRMGEVLGILQGKATSKKKLSADLSHAGVSMDIAVE